MTNARELANLVGGTLTNLTSGTDNVALGDEALEATTSGANNVGIGKDDTLFAKAAGVVQFTYKGPKSRKTANVISQ